METTGYTYRNNHNGRLIRLASAMNADHQYVLLDPTGDDQASFVVGSSREGGGSRFDPAHWSIVAR